MPATAKALLDRRLGNAPSPPDETSAWETFLLRCIARACLRTNASRGRTFAEVTTETIPAQHELPHTF